jgi:hypothetical protein
VSPRHGELLKQKIRFSAPLLEDVTARFWQHEQLAELYPRFLITIHGSVRATVPLMMAAVDDLRRRTPRVRLNQSLIEYLEQHAAEEAEHEEWLLQDLVALGINREATLRAYGATAIASLVGAQYYWIRHAHPVALLGCFAVLEGHPPTLIQLDDAQRRTGLPAEGFRMLRQHATLDVHHGAELFDLIDRLPLDADLAGLLSVSAVHTMGALAEMFGSLLATHPPVPQAVSAGRGT